MPHSSRVAVLETAIETGTRGTFNAHCPTQHLPTLMSVPAPGSRPSLDPVSDESTPKRDGRIGRRPESHGKRPFSHEISSKSHKKRKASLMKDSGNTYEATHIRPSIKKETGLPVDDSLSSSGSTSSGALSIKQKVSTGKVRQGRRNTIGNGGATIFGPPPRRHDSSSMVEMEVEWPGNDRREGSNVKNRRGSSSLTEPSMWDVSDSEMHTSDIKDESSDGESVGSDFSIGRDRQESVRSSGGSDYRRREKFNDILSRRGTVQDQEYVSSEGPTEPATNGHHRTEQNTLTRRIPHNHDNRIEDNSIAIPANVVTDRNSEYTVTGRRRQRAAAITQISARDISHSWRTASAADKMLVKMKQRGCSWLKIRKAWKELTGEWPAQSTLPNRYSRVKDNLTRLGPGEVRVSPYLALYLLFSFVLQHCLLV